MKNIELNHWGVENNKASISLSHLHAKFNVLKNDEYIYFQLIVTDSNMQTLTFNFYTLEDVITFTENVVSKCWINEEVTSKYQQMLDDGEFRLPGGMKAPKKEKITLTPNDVDEALIGYFGDGKNYRVSVREELSVDFHGNPKILFYLTEHLDQERIKNEYLLTESDLKTALAHYVDFYGYDLNGFKYIGGVHRVGYYFDEDTPHYEGIELKVTPKEKVQESPKKLIKTNKEKK